MEQEIVRFSLPALKINIRRLDMRCDRNYVGVHFHTEIELVRVDYGEIICCIDDKELLLSQGEMIFINSNVLHRIRCSQNHAKCTYMQINMSSYTQRSANNSEKYLYRFMCAKDAVKFCIYDATNEIFEIFSDILCEYSKRHSYYEEYIVSHCYHLAAFMMRNSFINNPKHNTDNQQFQKILPAVYYVEENFSNKLYLGKAAEISGMDKYYFCKLFKSVTGAPFIDYVNFFRLCKAEELLIDSAKNISEIAFDCGFSSVQYFNKVFKASRGCTPKLYRSMHFKII